MRFFRKLRIANPKPQENESECLSNGTIKRLEVPEAKCNGVGVPDEREDAGEANEGFDAEEDETGKSGKGTSVVGGVSSRCTPKFGVAGSSPAKDSRETAEAERSSTKDVSRQKRRHGRWENVGRKLTVCLDRPELVRWVALLLIGLSVWGVIYFVAGSHFVPGSRLFALIVLFVLAYVAGALIELIKLPPLLGMLSMGLLLRNVGFVRTTGVYVEVTATLREMALCIILIRAGLGLDPKALRSLKFVILRLASVPGIAEGLVTAILSHFLLGLPWLWGVLLGAILAAVSPAVVIPCLFSLQERGYGTGKGIPTLVVAAASLDDILAITVFGVVLGLIYSAGTNLTMQIVQGPLGIVLGIAFGTVWGFVSHFVPHRRDGQVVLLRVLMIVGGGFAAIVGSGALGCQGAGPLGCIIAAFVACSGWRKQDYSGGDNPVADVFRTIWSVFQPILFGLIGSEVDVSVLDMSIVGNGVLALVCSLLCRIVVTVLVAFGAGFDWKEKTFIAWAWFPKATVQAALGPLALDLARRNGSEEDVIHARTILVLAVLAILITAPLGATLIRTLGPRLLTREDGKPQTQTDEVGLESRGDEAEKS